MGAVVINLISVVSIYGEEDVCRVSFCHHRGTKCFQRGSTTCDHLHDGEWVMEIDLKYLAGISFSSFLCNESE